MALTKRRNRKILVCNNCRAKKNKCDRQKPCSSCIRLGMGDSCAYSELKLPSMIKNPISILQTAMLETLLDVPAKFVQTVGMSSVYPFLPIDPKDRALGVVFEYWLFKMRDKQVNYFPLSRHFVGLTFPKIKELEDASPLIGAIDYRDLDTGAVNINEMRYRISANGERVGMVYHPDPKYSTYGVIERLKLVLPLQVQLITYQKRFFDTLSMFIPVLDEFEFLDSIKRIFNILAPSTNKIEHITIKNKYDYAIVAITLLMLRLVYIWHLLCNKFNGATDNPIYLECVELAEECINIHGLLTQPTLALLQSLIFLQYYREVSPERQDGHLSDQGLRGHILEIAYALGLHRDPQLYVFHRDNPKIHHHLRRIIWNHIFQSNVFSSLVAWRSQKKLVHDFDTDWPRFQQGLSNLQNPIYEKMAVDGFMYCRQLVLSLTEILDIVQLVRPDYSKIDLLDYGNHLEIYYNNIIGHYNDTKSLPPGFFKIIRFKCLIMSKICLSLFFYTGYVEYEDANDLDKSIECLTRCTSVLFGELGLLTTNIFTDSQTVYGDTFDLTNRPWIIKAFHLIVSVCMNLMIRLKSALSILEESSDAGQSIKLNQLVGMLRRFLIVRVKYLILCSETCQIANKFTKIHLTNLLLAMDEDGIYKLFPELIKICAMSVSGTQVDALIKTFKPSWHTVESENIDGLNIFTVSDILSKDKDYHQRISNFMKYDKLWMAKSIMSMYKEGVVPREEGNSEGDDNLFNYTEAGFLAIPAFKTIYELNIE